MKDAESSGLYRRDARVNIPDQSGSSINCFALTITSPVFGALISFAAILPKDLSVKDTIMFPPSIISLMLICFLVPQNLSLTITIVTGNLDPKTSIEIFNLLKSVSLRGTTVIVSTHNHKIVKEFKERVLVLEDGKLVNDTLLSSVSNPYA